MKIISQVQIQDPYDEYLKDYKVKFMTYKEILNLPKAIYIKKLKL